MSGVPTGFHIEPVKGMVAQVQIAAPQPFSVGIRSQGGSETGAMDPSMISDADFAKAIEESIVNGRVFTSVVNGKDADYELGVTILNFNKPMFGASFAITLETAWSLTNTKTREAALRKTSHQLIRHLSETAWLQSPDSGLHLKVLHKKTSNRVWKKYPSCH